MGKVWVKNIGPVNSGQISDPSPRTKSLVTKVLRKQVEEEKLFEMGFKQFTKLGTNSKNKIENSVDTVDTTLGPKGSPWALRGPPGPLWGSPGLLKGFPWILRGSPNIVIC